LNQASPRARRLSVRARRPDPPSSARRGPAGKLELSVPPVLPAPAGALPLASAWGLWVHKRGGKGRGAAAAAAAPTPTSWYDGVSCVGRFDTVQGFWQVRLRAARARA